MEEPQNIRKVINKDEPYSPRYFADSDEGFDGTAQGWGYKSEGALRKAYWYSRHRAEIQQKKQDAKKFLKDNPDIKKLLDNYFSTDNVLDSLKEGEDLTMQSFMDLLKEEYPSEQSNYFISKLNAIRPFWKNILDILEGS